MVPSFTHGKYGYVIVGDSYSETLAIFNEDLTAMNLPAYEGLPSGFLNRIYYGPGKHYLIDESGNQSAGEPIVWELADTLKSRYAELLSVQQARKSTLVSSLTKIDFELRLSDAELDAFDEWLSGSARRRMTYNRTAEIDRSTYHTPLIELFGEQRSSELLS